MKTLAALSLAILTATTHAAQIGCPAAIKPGMSYHLARGKLIDAGLLPVKYGSEYHAGNSTWLHVGYLEAVDGGAMRTKPYDLPIFEWAGKGGSFFITAKHYDDPMKITVDHCSSDFFH